MMIVGGMWAEELIHARVDSPLATLASTAAAVPASDLWSRRSRHFGELTKSHSFIAVFPSLMPRELLAKN